MPERALMGDNNGLRDNANLNLSDHYEEEVRAQAAVQPKPGQAVAWIVAISLPVWLIGLYALVR
jgi:hypothetical protein